ncbi:hypothetical protein AVEN_122303-1 [Araneus ventricosus]|uniref:Uncharacterized protein n=1 Tax=Araneus ventricosus TaxID=182803 RepID=A0A4Y2P4K4_ARAVE|nr:hypothetical protein AVEN_219685-1 [Araneus ventricosus]GBN45976.1 hypothetical protein AVEN_122303-1 [Araneus ventricosus]
MDGNGLNPNALPVQEEASDKKINLVKEEEGLEDLEGSVFVYSKKPDCHSRRLDECIISLYDRRKRLQQTNFRMGS